jgi:hypothetical protein
VVTVRHTPETFPPTRGPHVSWSQRRRLEGVVTARRLRRIGEHLRRSGSIAVRESHAGFFGDRWTIWLDDDTLLKLKLFWTVKDNLAAVTDVWWNDYVGWMVRGRNTGGDVITLAAWSVRSVAGLRSL